MNKIGFEFLDSVIILGSLAGNNNHPDEYLEAIKSNDQEGLKMMVEDAARSKGYTHEAYKSYYEFSDDNKSQKINTFKRQKEFPSFHKDEPGVSGIAGFFTNDPSVARNFSFLGSPAWKFGKFFLRIDIPFIIDAEGGKAGEFQFEEGGIIFRDAIRSGLYDCVIIKNTSDEADVYVMLESSKIKSADIKTIDDSGKIIPLSKRFDSSNADFRF